MPAPFQITWDAPEFEYREKGVSWYWISIIAAACIVAFSVWFQNFLFGLFIVIAEVLFIVWGNREPRLIEFSLNEQGLSIDGRKFYGYKDFEAWSADASSDHFAEIYFYFRSRVKPALKVLLPAEYLNEFRASLKGTLKEVEHNPSFIDVIEKILRF
ncbi:MAG TPA: hypothetical protein VMU07_01320 [Candidatus Paceibacterota bacterium]|nr:hypothetical protein [Candidatus Paceibacterota bacterium]